MEKTTIHFEKEKDTKNTVKFEEVALEGQPKKIGSLYNLLLKTYSSPLIYCSDTCLLAPIFPGSSKRACG